jgi:hypothetical protein
MRFDKDGWEEIWASSAVSPAVSAKVTPPTLRLSAQMHPFSPADREIASMEVYWGG